MSHLREELQDHLRRANLAWVRVAGCLHLIDENLHREWTGIFQRDASLHHLLGAEFQDIPNEFHVATLEFAYGIYRDAGTPGRCVN